MPQFTRFPFLPESMPEKAVSKLIEVCRDIPADGEPFSKLRDRLRGHGMWDKQRGPDTLRFLRLACAGQVVPSELVLGIIASESDDAARELLAERLWEVNPILFKAVVDCLNERVYHRDELFGLLDSFAYRGEKVPRFQLEAWVHVAQGLGLIKIVGIALGLTANGEAFAERAQQLDVEEYIEEDEPEPELIGDGADVGADDDVSAEGVPASVPRQATVPLPKQPMVSPFSNPHGKERQVPVGSFLGTGSFDVEVLDETRRRLQTWWAEQHHKSAAPSASDFGLDAQSWMENSEEALYRLAVAAALVFRLGRDKGAVIGAYSSLDKAGVLDDLYFGTAPDALPDDVDPKALMLASLVARRCAESPELALGLEKEESAAGVFANLDKALGRGLFSIELFWMMRHLQVLGAVRVGDIQDFNALPSRTVRDVLFRMGFVDSPYAADSKTLALSSAAARRAVGDVVEADEVLVGFALAAGCSYGCSHTRSCEYACRERGESTT